MKLRLRSALLTVVACVFVTLALCNLASSFGAVLFKQLADNPLDHVYPFVPSPNYNMRPIGAKIDCIVLHSTAQPTLKDTVDRFLDPTSKVSAHFVVDKDGRVVQMVPIELRAWHAGVSALDGVSGVNDFSVGIEMVNLNDGKDPYTDAQYEAVAGIIHRLRTIYDIPDSRIVSHAQVALPPGRKSDPLGFDINRVEAMADVMAPTARNAWSASMLPLNP